MADLDAMLAFAEIAEAINDGALQIEAAKLRQAKREHDGAAARSEQAAVDAINATRAHDSTLADIARREAALEAGRTKLAKDRAALSKASREFDEYRDAENARLDGAGVQLANDQEDAAQVLAMREETEKTKAEVDQMKSQYEARLAEIGLHPAA